MKPTVLETNLESARSVFLAHCALCDRCIDFDHSGKSLGSLCWHGTIKYKALLDCEDVYMKHEQAKQRARERKLERSKCLT